MEDFKMLPEGTLAELINGELFMSPAATPEHQLVSFNLVIALNDFVRAEKIKGRIIYAPCDVYLDEDANAVQPDILYIAGPHKGIVRKDGVHGVPDLIIEILSPSNSAHDSVRKKALYEKFGVPEYWIVDPQTKESNGFILKNGTYDDEVRLMGKVSLRVVPGCELEF